MGLGATRGQWGTAPGETGRGLGGPGPWMQAGGQCSSLAALPLPSRELNGVRLLEALLHLMGLMSWLNSNACNFASHSLILIKSIQWP